MRTEEKKYTVERLGTQTEETFRIKASSKAFQILSSGLYSDKVTAIIRELSTNAYDAHVEAGTQDTPFLVHLPNKTASYFSVRDFGTGLSDIEVRGSKRCQECNHEEPLEYDSSCPKCNGPMETVGGLYTTYFESDKTDSNDYVGCLGLGSKSPFSYTDNFTVASYQDGRKTTYTAFINENGFPAITRMTVNDTEEQNGLEISFGVHADDYYEFYEKAARVYKHFKVMPEVTGHSGFRAETKEYRLTRKGWGLRKNDSYGETRSACAIMGNVSYPLHDATRHVDFQGAEMTLLNLAIDVEFDIGELEVTPSRESLSYTPRTLELIQERVKKIVKEIREEFESKLKDCKCKWDALILADSLWNGEYSDIKNMVSDMTWNGEKVSSNRVKVSDIENLQVTRFYQKRYYGNSVTHETSPDIMVAEKSALFINDLNRGSHIRCRKHQRDTANENVYLITLQTDKALRELRKALGMPKGMKIENVSTLPSPSAGRRSSGVVDPRSKAKLLEYSPSEYANEDTSARDLWQPSEVDYKEEEGVYVVIDRYQVLDQCDQKFHPYERMKALLQSYFDLTGDRFEDPIYGVRQRDVEKLEKRGGWVRFEDVIKEKLQEFVGSFDVRGAKDAREDLNSFLYEGKNQRVLLLLNDIPENQRLPLVQKVLVSVEKIQNLPNPHVAYNVAALIGADVDSMAETNDTEKVEGNYRDSFKELVETYPLLPLLDGHGQDGRIERIVDYMALVDVFESKEVATS